MPTTISQTPILAPTGISGLDAVLCGGLRSNSVVLIEGLPGTGKTILASELAQRAVNRLKQSTVYVSFETRADFYFSSFDSFGWEATSEANGVSNQLQFMHITPEHFVKEMLSETSALREKLKSRAAERIVIDGLTPLRLHFEEDSLKAYREFLRSTFDFFRENSLASIVITETEPSRNLGETGAGPEHFLADTVITLRKEEQHRTVLRSLEVAKSRGQKVLAGRHSFRVNDKGLAVFPRAYARDRQMPTAAVSDERVNFGIAGLEEMLGGGVYKGSSTLIVGISGTGKTVAAMHFLMEGLKRGENCLLASLDESAAQFCRNAAQLGLDFSGYLNSGQLTVLNESPLEIELDVHFTKIEAVVRSHDISLAVIDSLATYESLLPKECQDFLLALSTLLRSHGVTSLLAYECDELLGLSQISKDLKPSAIADNIILLNYVEISTTLRRAITVPKARGSAPDHQTKEYVIKKGGLTLLDEASVPAADQVPQLPLSCYYGVLARSPTRHSPMIDESVAAGKSMPKSKIPKPVKKSSVKTTKGAELKLN